MNLASANSATYGYDIFTLAIDRAIASQLVTNAVSFSHTQNVVH
jgi:hypothetical protein